MIVFLSAKTKEGKCTPTEVGKERDGEAYTFPRSRKLNSFNMIGLSQQPQASTLLMIDEAALKRIVADTVRQVLNQAKAEAEAAKEMATLTREEVAELLNVTKPTLWRWEKMGYLIPKKVGKRVLYLRSEVEEMVRKGGAV